VRCVPSFPNHFYNYTTPSYGPTEERHRRLHSTHSIRYQLLDSVSARSASAAATGAIWGDGLDGRAAAIEVGERLDDFKAGGVEEEDLLQCLGDCLRDDFAGGI